MDTAAGADAGMDETEVRQFLDGEEGIDLVRQENEAAHQMGISGVPCFIFEKRYAVSGAQEPEVFAQVFDLAVQKEQIAEPAAAPVS